MSISFFPSSASFGGGKSKWVGLGVGGITFQPRVPMFSFWPSSSSLTYGEKETGAEV